MNNPRIKQRTARRAPKFGALSAVGIAIYDYLVDHPNPVDEDLLLIAVMDTIPPAHGYRHIVAQHTAKKQATPAFTPHVVQRGKRRMAQQTMNGIARNGNAVRDHGLISLSPDVRDAYLGWRNK